MPKCRKCKQDMLSDHIYDFPALIVFVGKLSFAISLISVFVGFIVLFVMSSQSDRELRNDPRWKQVSNNKYKLRDPREVAQESLLRLDMPNAVMDEFKRNFTLSRKTKKSLSRRQKKEYELIQIRFDCDIEHLDNIKSASLFSKNPWLPLIIGGVLLGVLSMFLMKVTPLWKCHRCGFTSERTLV